MRSKMLMCILLYNLCVCVKERKRDAEKKTEKQSSKSKKRTIQDCSIGSNLACGPGDLSSIPPPPPPPNPGKSEQTHLMKLICILAYIMYFKWHNFCLT